MLFSFQFSRGHGENRKLQFVRPTTAGEANLYLNLASSWFLHYWSSTGHYFRPPHLQVSLIHFPGNVTLSIRNIPPTELLTY